MPDKQAAIDIDKVLERPLGELTAVQLIEVLNHPKVHHPGISLIADKKKYELWVEEGVIVRISVRDLLQKLRGEKKKVELEPLIDPGQRVLPQNALRLSEQEYAQLVEDIAVRIEGRLGTR